MRIYNTVQHAKSFAIELFWETWNIFVAAIVLTTVLFIAEYARVLIAFVENKNNIPRGLSEQLLSQTILPFIQYIDRIPYMDKVSVALFWSIAAIGIYILYSFVNSLGESLADQARIDRFSGMGFIRMMLIHFSEKIIAIIIFFVVIILGWSVLIQYWFQLISSYILSGFSVGYLIGFVVGFIGLFVTIYTLLITAYITWFYERRTLT